jgi:hypothetical protein
MKKLGFLAKLKKKRIANILLFCLLAFLILSLPFLVTAKSWIISILYPGLTEMPGTTSQTIVTLQITPLQGTETLQITPHVQGTETPQANSTPSPTPQTLRIALGDFTAGSSSETPAQELADYESLVSSKPGIQMWFANVTDPFPTADMNAIVARGVMPELTVELPNYSHQQCQDNPIPCQNKYVTNGNYDISLHRFAQAAATWGKPFLYRFVPEMNGNWNYFAPELNGNTASSFVSMWQHVVNLFRSDRAVNAQFVWAPNIIAPDAPDFRNLYPGDAYVNWMGLDGYNFGTINPASTWETFNQLYYASYKALLSLSPAKPIMIAEISSAEQGGSKSAWITNTFTEIPQAYPHIKAIIWFNTDKASEGETDWRVNSSPAALQSYRAIAQLPVYQGSMI